MLARRQSAPSATSARLQAKDEARVVFLGLTMLSAPLEPRWDAIAPFVWGDALLNARLAQALGPQRTVASVVAAMDEMYDVYAARLALDLLPDYPAEPLVHAVLRVLSKRGFGAQFPKAKQERARLEAKLNALAAVQPPIAEAIASFSATKRKKG